MEKTLERQGTVTSDSILDAKKRLTGITADTPLDRLAGLKFAEVLVKREDIQKTGAYKIRGAYNFLSRLHYTEKIRGVVCASTGNHAQAVAYCCNLLDIEADIFVPKNTPEVKVKNAKNYGKGKVDVVRYGESFDDAYKQATTYCKEEGKIFVHPFNNPDVISGQGTIAVELTEKLKTIDYVFVPVGGGGLISGIGTYLKERSPKTIVVGVEPFGAETLMTSMKNSKITRLDTLDTIAGAVAVKEIGSLTYKIAKDVVDYVVSVPDCMIELAMAYLSSNDINAEPAGALSLAPLLIQEIADKVSGKRVVCICSGGNVGTSPDLRDERQTRKEYNLHTNLH